MVKRTTSSKKTNKSNYRKKKGLAWYWYMIIFLSIFLFIGMFTGFIYVLIETLKTILVTIFTAPIKAIFGSISS